MGIVKNLWMIGEGLNESMIRFQDYVLEITNGIFDMEYRKLVMRIYIWTRRESPHPPPLHKK